MNTLFTTMNTWSIEKVGDKFQVTNPKYPEEKYEFNTLEYAEYQRDFCSRSTNSYIYFLESWSDGHGSDFVINSNIWGWKSMEFFSDLGDSVLVIKGDQIQKIYLGNIIKTWFVKTEFFWWLKKFWYGQKAVR